MCTIPNGSNEIVVRLASLYLDWHPVYSYVIEKCCCGVWVWWELIKLVGASCFYTCLEKTLHYLLYLLIGFLTYLGRGGCRVGVLVFS